MVKALLVAVHAASSDWPLCLVAATMESVVFDCPQHLAHQVVELVGSCARALIIKGECLAVPLKVM